MTFDDILAQIIDLLKRQGRVSYSALKRRFDLNDDYLNDLKDEILYVHPVRDDEGRGLIWTGDMASGQAVAPQPAQATQPPAAQGQPSPQVAPLPTAPPPDAERRQLTVMFCDLVESTKLSSQLDPEEYRDVVRAYQKTCTAVIERYDGYVAQLLGDGLLVYFGYPVAHEDDAHRAIHTGLGILDAMGDLNQDLQQAKGIQLTIRIDAWMLWFVGYPDQGKVRNDAAVTLAQQSAHPFSLSFILSFAAIFHQFRREMRCTQACAEATITLATEQGFPFWIAFGAILRGWALVHQGQAQAGVEQITQNLMTYRGTGAEILRPYWLALPAEAQGIMGQPEAGLTALAEALTLVDTTGERWYQSELYRLRGVLLLQQSSDNHTEAETCFQHAIRIAQSQQAKSWELRAATSLARLWQQQGKRQEAHDLLAPVYNWFTEGFDTADLQDAKALLDELA